MRHDHVVDEIEGKAYDARLMRRLLGYLRPYRWAVASAVGLLLAATPLELAGPWLVKLAIDRSIAAGNPSLLGKLALLYLGAALSVLGVRYTQIYLTQWVGQKAMLDLRMAVFRRLERLPLSYFDRTPVGTLMTRTGSDVEVLQELFSAGVITIFGDVATLLGIVALMLYLNWRLALVTFLVIPILFWATMAFRTRVRRSFRLIRQKVAALSASLQETITGIAVVQLFEQEKDNRRRYDELAREYREAYRRAIFHYAVFFPAVEVIGALGVALIILYGGGRIIAGAMTLGALVAFIEYTQRFMSPVQDLAEKYNILQSAMAAAERIFHVLDTAPQDDFAPPAMIPATTRGSIEFRDIRFAYREGEEVLRGVSFRIEPGQRVAIVGATGAGKTSIINLISRLYEPGGGSVLLDEVDIIHIPLPVLRRRVGIVLQEVFLFAGSVRDNLLLDQRARDGERARKLLREVGALELFERLPQGLDTPLRERAGILSVGQKQLLAFARALAYDPPVLILDEATSSLDPETEAAVQRALDRTLAGRTSIIIAHRLSTIRGSDLIIVMHRGKVRETGTHRELIDRQGIYWRLHQLQFEAPDR